MAGKACETIALKHKALPLPSTEEIWQIKANYYSDAVDEKRHLLNLEDDDEEEEKVPERKGGALDKTQMWPPNTPGIVSKTRNCVLRSSFYGLRQLKLL